MGEIDEINTNNDRNFQVKKRSDNINMIGKTRFQGDFQENWGKKTPQEESHFEAKGNCEIGKFSKTQEMNDKIDSRKSFFTAITNIGAGDIPEDSQNSHFSNGNLYENLKNLHSKTLMAKVSSSSNITKRPSPIKKLPQIPNILKSPIQMSTENNNRNSNEYDITEEIKESSISNSGNKCMKTVKSAAKDLEKRISTEAKETNPIKKSISVGHNYWTKFASSKQSGFLKKLFLEKSFSSSDCQSPSEKVKSISSNNNSNKRENSKVKEKTEEHILNLNVAQKASFFMKLEHEQRFSKWRKNEKETSNVIVKSEENINNTIKPNPNGKFSSQPQPQPVTNEEVEKVSYWQNLETATANAAGDKNDMQKIYNNKHSLSNDNQENSNNFLPTTISSTKDFGDDSNLFPSEFDPSKLSLKDRVCLFDKISINSQTQVNAKSDPYLETFGNPQPIRTDSNNNFKLKRRPDSICDFGALNKSSIYKPVPKQRSSLCVIGNNYNYLGGGSDGDLLSEDGEFSSGGQEVAEIFCRSYENSPMIRKKSWKSQRAHPNHQMNFTKEIWKKSTVGNNQDFSSGNSQYQSEFEDILNKTLSLQKTNTKAPTTSNLLPILTILSSSNDELNDQPSVTSPTLRTKKLINRSSSINRKSQEIKVPNADDESFQAFFSSSTTANKESFSTKNDYASENKPNLPKSNIINRSSGGFTDSMHINKGQDTELPQRQQEILSFKKNVPLVRRKSSGKSKNPIKSLAARIDFRNQKYTEVFQK